MRRETISFVDFKTHFIDDPSPDAYVPVEYFFEEDEETGEELRILKIDLICHWRLHDGKVRFYSVPFETLEEFNELVEYLRLINDSFHTHLREEIDKLQFPKETSDADA